MDRTDPFVQLTLGEHTASTTVKGNAGGTADFNEVLSMNRARQDSLLQVSLHLFLDRRPSPERDCVPTYLLT